jgi:5-hydroxyisourate hydrolase-like protein (transthyretin family)
LKIFFLNSFKQPIQLVVLVLDTSKGKPGGNVKIKLFKFIDNYWANSTAEQFFTDNNGRFSDFPKIDDDICGTYKLKFEVEEYFKNEGKECLYPYVEVRKRERASKNCGFCKRERCHASHTLIAC